MEGTTGFTSLIRYRIPPMNESYRERGSKGKLREPQSQGATAIHVQVALLWGQWDRCDQVGSRASLLLFRELTLARGGRRKHRADLAVGRCARHQEAITLAWEPGGKLS